MPVDLSGLSERWDTLVGQLCAYDSQLEGQRASLAGALGKRAEELRATVAGFASRCELDVHRALTSDRALAG